MRAPGIVLVVDGAVHVGRRTTIAGLQRAWPEVRSGPLLAVGLEAAMRSLGPASRRWSELVQPHTTGRGEGSGHVTWGPLGREVVVGVAAAAAAWARAGFDVAVDLVLPDRATLAEVTAALEGLFVLHVGLVCDPDVLEDRERELGVSAPGTAVAQLHATASVADRDLVLDTSESTTDELVTTVLTELRRRARG